MARLKERSAVDLEILDLKDVKQLMVAKIKIFEDNNPLKASVHNYIVRGEDGSRKASHDGRLYLDHVSSDTDNYSLHKIYPKLTQDLIDDPWLEVEFYTWESMGHEVYQEIGLEVYLRDIMLARDFLPSNYFKFDIDGKENTKPGFKFSEIKPLAPNERFDFYNGALHISKKSLHQPVPLKIAQYKTPEQIKLKNGKTVTITHISELGELIYSAKGLKSVDKSLLDSKSYDSFLDRRGPTMADSLDDSLVGDKAQYRASFLEMFKGSNLGRSY